jgi:hypothetical protein
MSRSRAKFSGHAVLSPFAALRVSCAKDLLACQSEVQVHGRRAFALCAVVLVATASPARSQGAAEIPEGLSSIDDVRELRDGRVLVLDTQERRVRIADFSRNAIADFGRKGSGPGEYQAPVGLFAMPGDSTAIFDGPSGRVLMFAPDGSSAGFVNSAGLTVKSAGAISRFVPRYSDSLGNLYAVGLALAIGPKGPALADSFGVSKWNRRDAAPTVVAWGRARSLRDRGGDVDPQEAIFHSLVPFVIGDQVAVGADGRVAVLRWDRYAVDFVLPDGRAVRGPELPSTRLPVSEALKEQWRDEHRQAGQSGRVSEPPRWPDVMPLFLTHPAMFDPDGVLWVRRTSVPGSSVPYDLISATGRLLRQRIFGPREHVVGFSSAYIYVARTDDDDLQYLRRYKR